MHRDHSSSLCVGRPVVKCLERSGDSACAGMLADYPIDGHSVSKVRSEVNQAPRVEPKDRKYS